MITPSLDLRGRLLPVRHQGRRQSCLAFASSTAHEHHAGPGEHLSVEYLFYHSVARMPGQNPAAGTTMLAAAAALSEEGQPAEPAWPYTPDQLSPWMPPPITGKLHKNTMVAGKLGFEAIVTVLNQGSPVILGLVITDAFYGPNDVGVIVDKNPDIERGGHAVLAVGHGTGSATDPALLIRNSWGQDWGLGGYAWLSRGYLARQLHETATLT